MTSLPGYVVNNSIPYNMLELTRVTGIGDNSKAHGLVGQHIEEMRSVSGPYKNIGCAPESWSHVIRIVFVLVLPALVRVPPTGTGIVHMEHGRVTRPISQATGKGECQAGAMLLEVELLGMARNGQ